MNELWAGRSMAVSVYSGTAAASIHVNLCHCRGTISLRICLGPYGESTVASRATCGGDATPTTTEAMAYFLFSPSLPFRPRRWAQYMNQQLLPRSLPHTRTLYKNPFSVRLKSQYEFTQPREVTQRIPSLGLSRLPNICCPSSP